MKNGFVYTRWLLTLTFCCLMGLLAVGMMTVHSKRTIRSLAVNLDRKETDFEELQRRQDTLDTDLAISLNPEYLKQLVAMNDLRLGPPREDRIIVVHPKVRFQRDPKILDVHPQSTRNRTPLELANSILGDGD